MVSTYARRSPSKQNDLYYLKEINVTIEELEDSIQANNKNNACQQAKKAGLLIKNNLQGLSKIEPDYNWNEIKKVLKITSVKYCS